MKSKTLVFAFLLVLCFGTLVSCAGLNGSPPKPRIEMTIQDIKITTPHDFGEAYSNQVLKSFYTELTNRGTTESKDEGKVIQLSAEFSPMLDGQRETLVIRLKADPDGAYPALSVSDSARGDVFGQGRMILIRQLTDKLADELSAKLGNKSDPAVSSDTPAPAPTNTYSLRGKK